MQADEWDRVNRTIRLLDQYTGGSFNVDHLCGPHKAAARQHILTMLQFGPSAPLLPKKQCGFNAVRDHLFKMVKASGNCIAAREANIREYCRGWMEVAQ